MAIDKATGPARLSVITAFQRFGLGARGYGGKQRDIDTIRGAPKDALLAEVSIKLEPSPFAGLAASSVLIVQLAEYRGQQKAARQTAADGSKAAAPATPSPPKSQPAAKAPAGGETQSPELAPAMANPVQTAMKAEVMARLGAAARAGIGFQERLVLFWSNHFTVAGINPRVRILAGSFEREAIRPHLTAKFEDMLQAVESHPAMLMYLDNAQSFGPTSHAGQRRAKGLNENLAREILELHSVGVDGGYAQADVTRFAEILTGWTVVGPQAQKNGLGGDPGTFAFRPQMHEPGARSVMGQSYPQTGIDQGQAVLRNLSRHPATARFIATKLCRHFIADMPPKPAIDRVEAAFKTSGGNLLAVYDALLSAPEAWDPAPGKLRTPNEYVLATMRALGLEPEFGSVMRSLNLMGQVPFQAPSPKGWPEETAAWIAPDAFKTRIDFAELAARRAQRTQPLELAQTVLGPLLSDETATAIRRAESAPQAVTLLLMSPEFQRR